MLKLGTRLRSFISGNICLEFSVQWRVVTKYFNIEPAVERDGGGGIGQWTCALLSVSVVYFI